MAIGNIIRQALATDNVGGMVQGAVVLASAFTSPWPLKTHRSGTNKNVINVAPTLVTGTKWGNLKFNLDKGMLKSSRKGKPGATKHKHEGSMEFTGIEDAQLDELDKTKEGVLIIMWDQDGRKWLAGTSCRPLTFEYDVEFGTSAVSDVRHITAKFNEDGYAHGLLRIDDAITLVFETITGETLCV